VVVSKWTKPVLVTEYGCPGYAEGYTQKKGKYQAMYWPNQLGRPNGHMRAAVVGNVLGGVLSIWIDEGGRPHAD